MFKPGFTSPTLLEGYLTTPLQDYHLLWSTIQVVHGAMSLSAFARRYLRNRGCFLFLWVLRCFSSPGSLPTPMHSVPDTPEGVGFPIRTSMDQSLFASSPWLIAGYNVLHRLSTPSHPPHALSSLFTPTEDRSHPFHHQLTPTTSEGHRHRTGPTAGHDLHPAIPDTAHAVNGTSASHALELLNLC